MSHLEASRKAQFVSKLTGRVSTIKLRNNVSDGRCIFFCLIQDCQEKRIDLEKSKAGTEVDGEIAQHKKRI